MPLSGSFPIRASSRSTAALTAAPASAGRSNEPRMRFSARFQRSFMVPGRVASASSSSDIRARTRAIRANASALWRGPSSAHDASSSGPTKRVSCRSWSHEKRPCAATWAIAGRSTRADATRTHSAAVVDEHPVVATNHCCIDER